MSEQLSRLEQGPLLEETQLTGGLDFYKLTMSQVWYRKYPDVEVTFQFHNRGTERLADHLDAEDFQARLDQIRDIGWTEPELDYTAGLQKSNGTPMFTPDYIDYLRTHELPRAEVGIDPKDDDIDVTATGPAPLVTFWETKVMSELSETYFANKIRAEGLDMEALYAEGDRRLDEWVGLLHDEPGIKITEFGTRRRQSLRQQRHAIDRLANECSDNYAGTSNIAFSAADGTLPKGTVAHEMGMGWAAIADAMGEDIRGSQRRMEDDWEETYSPDMLLKLPDTYTTDFALATTDDAQLERWDGFRQDSGDPLEFTAKAIARYHQTDIDPHGKKILYSDGLDAAKVYTVHQSIKDEVHDSYGVGTALSNNNGLKPLNIVMKLAKVCLPDKRTANGVKLSDDPGKHTGPTADVHRHQKIFAITAKETHDERISTSAR